ncbi:multiple organellar RNA editing factor 2, chloroplastic-like [Hordeum vulgare subsp. vulgare]|uniref:multiple organellar RNA editing factor 2, chloroplastic-like n=1 Tax=Hordeum vulgare subsp. vulgare TaxID=112509 RepID=UPI001D1A4444|nr:multiple organellar RNA editing factor 2, chloroplastic-like [Hordeum vulgare subsp. vulgare]
MATTACVAAPAAHPVLLLRCLPCSPACLARGPHVGHVVVRCMARRPDASYSPLRSGQDGDRVPTEMAPLFPRCDYEHLIIVMDKPSGKGGDGATKQQMIGCYSHTLTTVVGSMEAEKRMYNVSRECYFGFGCEIDEETSSKLEAVLFQGLDVN